jgi:hypothetical protein
MMEPDEINEGHCYRLTASNGRKVIVRVERFSTSTIKIGREIAGTAGGDVEFETKMSASFGVSRRSSALQSGLQWKLLPWQTSRGAPRAKFLAVDPSTACFN